MGCIFVLLEIKVSLFFLGYEVEENILFFYLIFICYVVGIFLFKGYILVNKIDINFVFDEFIVR